MQKNVVVWGFWMDRWSDTKVKSRKAIVELLCGQYDVLLAVKWEWRVKVWDCDGAGRASMFPKNELENPRKICVGHPVRRVHPPPSFSLHNKVREHYLLYIRFHFPQKWKWYAYLQKSLQVQNVQITSKYFCNFFRFAYSHCVWALQNVSKFFNLCVRLVSIH